MQFLKLKTLSDKTTLINPNKILQVTFIEEENIAKISMGCGEYEYVEVQMEHFLKETGNFL